MVDEIIGKKFLEQLEIATSLHLFGVTPDDTLGDLAYRTPTHSAILLIFASGNEIDGSCQGRPDRARR
jgi:hypothetical protein